MTNAVASVRAEEITNVPIASIDGALQGKAPGLQVIQNAGNPGNGMTVRVRGSSSLSAGNQPLYVIDGVPMLRDIYSQLSEAREPWIAAADASLRMSIDAISSGLRPLTALRSTDWQEAMLQTAPVYDVAVGLTGGSERIGYFLSGSLFNQTGIVLGSAYNRGSMRANVDFSPSSRLSLRTSIGLTREDNDRNENDNTIDGVATNAIANQPNVPVRNPNGTFTSTDDGLEYTNPIALGALDAAESRTLRALGNTEATFTLTDALRLNGRIGMDTLNLRDLRWNSPQIIGTYAAGRTRGGRAGDGAASVGRGAHAGPVIALITGRNVAQEVTCAVISSVPYRR